MFSRLSDILSYVHFYDKLVRVFYVLKSQNIWQSICVVNIQIQMSYIKLGVWSHLVTR